MIKFISTAVFFLIALYSQFVGAQDFQGQASYESKTNIRNSVNIDSPNITPEMQALMQEQLKKAFEKSYTLSFTKTESVYEEPLKLENPSAGSGGVMVKAFSSGDGKIYKNIKDKKKISEEDFFGKEFLITDSLKNWNWKLENETKKIGEYVCYKAVSVVPVTEEDKKRYEEHLKKKKNSPTQLMIMEEPKERLITVWYAPEIPISQGPGEYWGLPGLILEVNDGRTTILCSKIVLNPKEKITIATPKNGKKVTQKEYDKIVAKKMEEMQDSKGNIRLQVTN